MTHMQQEITSKQPGWLVETRDHGTCYVPGDVHAVPDWLKLCVPLTDKDDGDVFTALADRLKVYVPALHIQSVEAVRGYFARLSAPGYTDCTEWSCFGSIKEAREYLREI